MTKPIEIFISYAHKDETYLNELKKHLKPLQDNGLIQTWSDADISAGTDWQKAIETHLNTAHVFLLLISPNFMASDYCQSVEMKQAVDRDHRGEARVIPVIVRTIAQSVWETAPFSGLQALPKGAKPIEDWRLRTHAYASIVDGIYKAIITPPVEPLEVSSPYRGEVPTTSPKKPLTIFRRVLAILVALALLGGIYYAGSLLIHPPPSSTVLKQQKMDATATQVARGNISATQTAATEVDVRANGVYAQGIPLVYDRLNANSPSKWSENRDPHGNWGCQFQDGAYHVYQKLQDSVVTCVAESTDLPDYTYEVTMSLLKGDSGGLLFRVNSPKGMYLYYYFLIIPNGGKYQFGLFNGKFQPLKSDFSSAILTDLKQNNVLAVHVNKDTITLYANYQKIYSVKDTSYSHGAVGVFVYEHSSSTEVVFTDARIWTP